MTPFFARPVEVIVAAYALAVGLLFLLDPNSLSPAVYAPWHDLGRHGWGVLLVGVSAIHFSAIWLNGRSTRVSRPVRLAAVFLHLSISLQFAWMFHQGGAEWGVMTFGILLPGLLWVIASRVIGRVRNGVTSDEL